MQDRLGRALARAGRRGRYRVDPIAGRPARRAHRPLSAVVDMVADGMSTPEILEAYPELRRHP